METIELREELHHLIDQADDKLLEIILTMMLPKKVGQYELTESQKAILDDRLKKINDESGSGWDEVKARIRAKL
ncbi:MAG: putative addiction module component (TIGR02574 family) [Marinoscillum sp.]|jgi:putative addiction module component (TIGR02574 family)